MGSAGKGGGRGFPKSRLLGSEPANGGGAGAKARGRARGKPRHPVVPTTALQSAPGRDGPREGQSAGCCSSRTYKGQPEVSEAGDPLTSPPAFSLLLPLIHHCTSVGRGEAGGRGEKLCFRRALGVRRGMTACPGCACVWRHRLTAGSRVPSFGETDSQHRAGTSLGPHPASGKAQQARGAGAAAWAGRLTLQFVYLSPQN